MTIIDRVTLREDPPIRRHRDLPSLRSLGLLTAHLEFRAPSPPPPPLPPLQLRVESQVWDWYGQGGGQEVGFARGAALATP